MSISSEPVTRWLAATAIAFRSHVKPEECFHAPNNCYTPDWWDRIGLSKLLSPNRLDQIGLTKRDVEYIIGSPISMPVDAVFRGRQVVEVELQGIRLLSDVSTRGKWPTAPQHVRLAGRLSGLSLEWEGDSAVISRLLTRRERLDSRLR